MSLNPEIDGLNHPLMELTRTLLRSEGVAEEGKFIIDDPENIQSALEAGIELESLFFYGDHAERHQEFLKAIPATVNSYPIRPRTCKKLFGNEKESRVFAIAKVPTKTTMADLTGDIAILDGLRLTGNIGAIIRSALAFNIGGIVLVNMDAGLLYDRRLIRASKGYLFKVPVIWQTENDLLNFCREQDLKIVNCCQAAKQSIQVLAQDPARMAFVLGSEKYGTSASMAKAADIEVKIPFNDTVESLNVSVAAAITFYSRYRA